MMYQILMKAIAFHIKTKLVYSTDMAKRTTVGFQSDMENIIHD
jgi:hypothetical protein